MLRKINPFDGVQFADVAAGAAIARDVETFLKDARVNGVCERFGSTKHQLTKMFQFRDADLPQSLLDREQRSSDGSTRRHGAPGINDSSGADEIRATPTGPAGAASSARSRPRCSLTLKPDAQVRGRAPKPGSSEIHAAYAPVSAQVHEVDGDAAVLVFLESADGPPTTETVPLALICDRSTHWYRDGAAAVSKAKFVSYDVLVQVDGHRWVVHRRYTDFCALADGIRHLGDLPPKLPGKRTFGNFKDDFIEARRGALEAYLQGVVENDETRAQTVATAASPAAAARTPPPPLAGDARVPRRADAPAREPRLLPYAMRSGRRRNRTRRRAR
ncbi:hypothetical protein JL720_15383 [Aureococcus anophagefferens]|nr:hypothetical protein JL720_15383 [Aureococcus anophagefferens]